MKRFHEWMAERGRSIENGTAMQLADNLIEYVEEGMAKYEPVMEERFQFINKATGRPELPGPDHETEVRRYVHPAFPYENPRTPAETEAMLDHMADVHLTPTEEKLK